MHLHHTAGSLLYSLSLVQPNCITFWTSHYSYMKVIAELASPGGLINASYPESTRG
jgi:hypothetical protein